MNTKQLLLLLLSIVSLQQINLSACPRNNDPMMTQFILVSFIASDFENLCGKDSSLGLRATNPQDLATSEIEIYDTEKNCRLILLNDKNEAFQIYGMKRNANKTILVTFMLDAAKYKHSDDFTCFSAKVWDIKSGTCLFTIPHVWAGQFIKKSNKLKVFGARTKVWDTTTGKQSK